MSTRPVQDLPSPPRAAVDPALRIQLEGAWEVLEQARTRQDALLKSLASRCWRSHLRRKPELLRQVLELQAPLAEALGRTEHRWETDSPEASALRLLLRQVWAQRARLETLVLERLEGVCERGTPFARAIERLEERVREPLSLQGEHVRLCLHPGPKGLLPFFGVFCLGVMAWIVYHAFHGHETRGWAMLRHVVLQCLPLIPPS